jgi:hypothetical protein
VLMLLLLGMCVYFVYCFGNVYVCCMLFGCVRVCMCLYVRYTLYVVCMLCWVCCCVRDHVVRAGRVVRYLLIVYLLNCVR